MIVSDFSRTWASDVIGTATFAVRLEQADSAPHAASMFKGKLI